MVLKTLEVSWKTMCIFPGDGLSPSFILPRKLDPIKDKAHNCFHQESMQEKATRNVFPRLPWESECQSPDLWSINGVGRP